MLKIESDGMVTTKGHKTTEQQRITDVASDCHRRESTFSDGEKIVENAKSNQLFTNTCFDGAAMGKLLTARWDGLSSAVRMAIRVLLEV